MASHGGKDSLSIRKDQVDAVHAYASPLEVNTDSSFQSIKRLRNIKSQEL